MFGDTLSGRFRTSVPSKLYFSNNITKTNLNGLVVGRYYKYSARIRLRSTDYSDVSIKMYEYFEEGDTKITSTIARNRSGWQELIIFKGLDFKATGVSFSLETNNTIDYDDVSVKEISNQILIGGASTNRVRNIVGDTLFINNIQSIGDSKITFVRAIFGDTLVFNTIDVDNFVNGLSGDTLNVDTLETDNLKSRTGDTINLLSKLMGDTILFKYFRCINYNRRSLFNCCC